MAHPYWPLFDLRVRTPRIELRAPDDDDAVAIAALAAGGIHPPGTMPFALPWTDQPSPMLERSTLQFVWRQRAEWKAEEWHMPLVVSENGQPVGVQGVNAKAFRTLRLVETGSWLGRAHQGRGLGKEMRAAVLHLAFAGLGADTAYSGAWEDNAASLAVSRALGYVDNGDLVALRRDRAGRQIRLKLHATGGSRAGGTTFAIDGLEPCLGLFGAD